MARQLFVAALLLGGAIVAIVRAQDNEPTLAVPSPVQVDAATDAEVGSEVSTDPEQPSTIYTRRSISDSEAAPGPQDTEEDAPSDAPSETTVEGEVSVSNLPSVLKRRAPESRRPPREAVNPSREPARFTPDRSTETTTTTDEPKTYSTRTKTASPRATAATGTSDVTVMSRAPSVHVEVHGPAAGIVGKETNYRVSLINDGADIAHDLEIRLGLPAHVRVSDTKPTKGDIQRDAEGILVWKVTELIGGADENLTLVLAPQEEKAFDIAIEWSVRPQGIMANVQVQKPQLAVEISGPDDVLYGAHQIYTISISNPGTGPAENVSLDVTTGGGSQTKRVGLIPPGGREQIRMELVARESGQLDIEAVAVGDGLRHQDHKKILVRRAELGVEVVGPSRKFAGGNGKYEVRIINNGNAPATGVELSLRKPAGVKYAGGLEDAVESAGRIAWKIDQLEVGQQRVYRMDVTFEQAGNIVCEAVASAAGDLTAADTCETQVEAMADLKLVVNDPESPKVVGDEVVYEIHVSNRGTKASGPIHVIGQFSNGIEPLRAEGAESEIVPGQIIFKEIPRIDAGQTLTLKILARADQAGNHRFRAVLKSADPDTELIAEDMTRFFSEEMKEDTSVTRVTRGNDASTKR